jgi:hypothetical protein
MVDRADLALAKAALHRQVTFQRVFNRRCVERLAILELHARTQMNHQRLVVRPFVPGGELRHDVQLCVDIEQLVAQAGEHDATDIGGGNRRVHHVQILA